MMFFMDRMSCHSGNVFYSHLECNLLEM
jgi:hypothetical protein